MIKPEQIHADKSWMNVTLSVFSVEFSHVASKNLGMYNKIFLKNVDELGFALRRRESDFSTGPESEYFIHMRKLLRKYHEVAVCCTSTLKLAEHQKNMLQVTGNLINEIQSVDNIQQVKGYFNDIIQLIRNCEAASQPVMAK